jgi:gliding motility-associated-like protein
MRKIYLAIVSLFFLANTSKGQLTTTQTLTPQQLVQTVLLGSGVTASNITYSGSPLQIAQFFATTSSSLGIPTGIFLSSGNASTSSINGPQGPNNAPGTTTGFGGNGDNDLDNISVASTEDAAVLEFDFIPTNDSVKFRYCFGSEEYPEFVGSFNDVFAFLLTGPNPLGGNYTNKNIALVPGTSTPVTINNVNAASNNTWYRSNTGNAIHCEFDGITKVMYALEKVVCGQTYHIKIAIADAADDAYDSGVFLEGGSFSSLPPLEVFTLNSNSNIPDSVIVEDCNTYCAYFIRNGNLANADSFNLQVSGNAILGTDYIQSGNPGFAWPTVLHFAANQDTIKFCNIQALQDNMVEGTDTLKFEMSSFATSSVSCLSSNSIKFNLYLKDYTPITIGQNDVSLCSGNSTILNASPSFGYPAYSYTIESPAVTTATLNTGPITSPTIFTITVNDICNKPVTKQITVTPVAIPTVTVNDTILCSGNAGFLYASGASTYSWSSGAATSSITVTPTTTTNYTVVGSVGTCTNSAVSTVSVVGQAISITGNNNICFGQSTILTASGGSVYNWDNGASTNTILVTPSTQTSYTVTSVAASCTNMAVYTVSVTSIPNVVINGSVTCAGQTTTLTASGATFYSWSTGSNTHTTSVSPTVNTSYTVTGIVASCTNLAVYEVTVIPTPTITPNYSVICNGDSAFVIANGGLTYQWSTGATNDTIIVKPSTTTNYTVVGAVGSCTNSAVATVSVVTPAVTISGSNNICIGQSVTLTASGGGPYTWSTGETSPTITVTPTTNTTYTATSVVASCTDNAIHTVTVTPKPIINVSGTTICPGQNGVVTATGATTYTWSTGETTSSITVNPTVNTTYTVMGTTIPTCTDTAVYTVNVITAQPNAYAVVGPSIFCMDSIGAVRLVISNGNPPYTVDWIIPVNGMVPYDTAGNVYYFTQSGATSNENYTIVITDQCSFKDTVHVNLQVVDCNILIPNVVTPNGDGVNDYFKINGLDNFPGSSLTAFNRWGKKIYNSDDYKNDWRPDENAGTYFYIVNISDGRTFNGFFQIFKD